MSTDLDPPSKHGNLRRRICPCVCCLLRASRVEAQFGMIRLADNHHAHERDRRLTMECPQEALNLVEFSADGGKQPPGRVRRTMFKAGGHCVNHRDGRPR